MMNPTESDQPPATLTADRALAILPEAERWYAEAAAEYARLLPALDDEPDGESHPDLIAAGERCEAARRCRDAIRDLVRALIERDARVTE
jgi:hypothetical protein